MRWRHLALAVIAACTCACGGNSNSVTAPSGTTATFNLRLTDSPFNDAKAVLVTFSEVTAHRSDSDFTKVPFADGATARTCDLKRLMAAQDVLGTGPLPVGHYTMIRLVVSSAALYFDNTSAGTAACAPTITVPGPGRSASIEIPSGEVRLNRQFDLSSSTATTMLLDFKGDQSIREIGNADTTGNGRYSMTPVIAVVSVQ